MLVTTQIASCSPNMNRNSAKKASRLSNIESRRSRKNKNHNNTEPEKNVPINLTYNPGVK
ncbi:hypothetical protein GCM10010495_82150 [Kitasatospora herbaricolor]|nr:hypothetical protein GCM10010495_82150 [Kitasatospora herbaricolor]